LSYCGIDSTKAFNNSAAYLQNWLSRLGKDASLLISAASEAQKRFDWILAGLGKVTEDKHENDKAEEFASA
jgi:antirestriction protein ArdC